jgi:hypothetical protein
MYKKTISPRKALLGLILLGAISVIINVKSGWLLVSRAGFPNKNHFDDLSLVIDWSECFREIGNGVYSTQTQDGCGGYLYGQPLLHVINVLNISRSQIDFISTFLIVASVFCLAIVAVNYQKNSISSLMITAALIFSPNYFLLIERMNVDLIVILMLVFAGLALKSGKFSASYILIAATALFKFYTLPLLVFVTLKYGSGKSRIVALLLTGVVAIKILIDIQRIKGTFPSTWFISFGLQIWGKYLNLLFEMLNLETTQLSWPIETLVGLTLIALVGLAFLFVNHTNEHLDEPIFYLRPLGKEDLLLFEFLSIPFLTCYFLNTSYDYRLPLLSVALCLVLKYQSGVRYRIFGGLALMATWMTVYIPFPTSGTGVAVWQMIGDLSMIPLVIALLLLLVNSSSDRLALKLKGLINWR